MGARLVLEDGTVVEGVALGARTTVYGELVFNTSMTGYQEALTDPSYAGQILMFTYPLMGNYGIHKRIAESPSIKAWGCVVRESCAEPWHPESESTLDAWLRVSGVPGIAGVDTRALTVKCRTRGTMRAFLTTDETARTEDLQKKLAGLAPVEKDNLVAGVAVKDTVRSGRDGAPRVVLVDCGVKESIVRELAARCEVVRVPWNTPAEAVLGHSPAGVLISNGPGDPAHPEIMKHTVRTARDLMGEVPLYGICLGHQILSLAAGGTTYKLKFGHRGANQPVRRLDDGRVYITSQNHGFAVDPKSLEGADLHATEENASDGTCEGVGNRDGSIAAVQYHPEAHPGPWDAAAFFDHLAKRLGGPR